MATAYKVLQKNGHRNQTALVEDGNVTQTETTEEVIPEVRGSQETSTITGGTETDEEAGPTGHQAVSSPSRSTNEGVSDEPSDEASEYEEATDTEYDLPEGYEEPETTEAKDEPLLEASFADAEASSQDSKEFFGALAGLLAPLIPTIAKAVMPSVGKAVGGLVKTGVKKLSPKAQVLLKNPQLQQLLNSLKAAGVNVKLEANEESGDEATGEETTLYEANEENDVEASLARQIDAIESLIGKDDRIPVKKTSNIPWKRICHLKITASNGTTFSGTGFFIGKRTIVTAGHCVYLHGHGGWAKKIEVTPARNGSEAPFGSFTSTSFRSVRGWVDSKARNYDYGVIQLSKTDKIPAGIGSFGVSVFSDASILNLKLINTYGYPGDKEPGTMWGHKRKANAVTTNTIIYDIDTMPGQSGSPVWIKKTDGSRMALAIHTNGSQLGNSATRITQSVANNLLKWRNEGDKS